MAKAIFLDSITINVTAFDGEMFVLKAYLPVPKQEQQTIANLLAHYFDEVFSDDKTRMVYGVLMKMMAYEGFSFYLVGSDRSEERKRIGAKIRRLRESKGIEAKQLAMMANIDPANLSRIEKGRYSVGFDILSKISDSLGVKVDLV